MAFNIFGPNTSLPFESVRSPDARSDPIAPIDQLLAPPPMPVCADSHLDFVRGFGLDVDEVDAGVGSVTTAAQSRMHSRHVQGSREGDLEDDSVEGWTSPEEI
jgi:hypothetical protein